MNSLCETQNTTIRPAYRIREEASGYTLEAQLPGVAKEQVELTVTGNALRLVARRAKDLPEGWSVLRRESSDRDYALNLNLGESIDRDNIRADVADGLLTLSLPKAQEAQSRSIAVN